ncbi:uncharacterized protein LOC124112878 [Haliotis rufescens]|uniref:uncharacterized protein LOC124112878 n=1 Tax=Haliotis rufescens TaxID=6454 RepID=UPI00201E7D85|nr:uncharacterized protein LOC124112878 [Haliotis rufescens]
MEENVSLSTSAGGSNDIGQGDSTHGDDRQTSHDDDVSVIPQGTHGGETFTMDNPSSSDVVLQQTGHDAGVSVVPQGTQGDETFTMDNPSSADVVLQQTSHDDDVSVVPQGTHGGETFTMDNPSSADVVLQQTGHDAGVSVVPQGTHGGETFSMDMVAATEIVERQVRSGNGAMAVSERRERQAVSTRITAGPDFKGIIVQDSSDVNLSLGGQNAGIMTSDLFEINLKRVKDVFVKTANYKRVKEQLEKYGHVTISGASGEGKTSIALMVGADLRKHGYELVFVDDVDKFNLENCELRGKKVCLILDDIYGTVGLSTDVPHLKSILQNLKHYLQDGKSTKGDLPETRPTTDSFIRVIFTTKSYNLEAGIAELDGQEFYFFSEFFREPLFYLRRELKTIMKRKNNQSAAFILMLLCENNLNLSQVEMESENEILEAHLQAVNSVVTITSRTAVAEAARCYRGTFFTEGDIIGFSHPTIYDACACALFNMNPSFVLKHCSIRFLYERVQPQQVESTAIDNHLHIIFVSSVYNDAIASRLAEAIAKGNYSMSITHPILKKEQIVDKVFQKLKLRKSNTWERWLNTEDNKRLQMLHAKEEEKHLLFWAVHAQSLYLVERIIEVGYHFSDEEIIEAFEACASCGNESVLLLLSSNYRRWLHQSVLNKALVIATEHNYKGVVSALLELGADVFKSTNHDEENVFQIVNTKGYNQLGREVLNFVLKGLPITELSGDFDFQIAADAALRHACTTGDVQRLKLFLPIADINARDFTGNTFSMYACSHGYNDVSNLFQSHGVDITLIDNYDDTQLPCHAEHLLPFFNIRGPLGWTGVMIAAACAKKDVYDLLVSKGADLRLPAENNNTVFHLACKGGNRYILEHLLPSFDIDSQGQNGWTAVMNAAFCAKKDVFDLLVSKGADLALKDDRNNTVLPLACQGGNRSIVEHLLPLFDIDSRGQNVWTAVMNAAFFAKKDVFDLLVSRELIWH